jgi:hypothetical protein
VVVGCSRLKHAPSVVIDCSRLKHVPSLVVGCSGLKCVSFLSKLTIGILVSIMMILRSGSSTYI